LNGWNGWNHSQCIEGADYFESDEPKFSDRRPADKLLNEIFHQNRQITLPICAENDPRVDRVLLPFPKGDLIWRKC